VIKEAVDQNQILHQSGYLKTNFSINISARQFRFQDIPEIFKRIQEEVCIDLQAITLEITETSVMEDMDRSIKLLKTLRDMGINIMLDDFGTGYSSINNLRFLPVSGIKIDLSLTKDVATSSDAAMIARAIINMAHGLNKTVVAEGVENEQQLEFLRSNKCDMVQGYLLGRPMPIQSLMKLLQKNNTISILSCVGKDSKYLNGSTRVYRSGAVQLAKKR
jgi:EAL domain-containing protein (putative c-di-GMP-specific phosphodiesterase class I)